MANMFSRAINKIKRTINPDIKHRPDRSVETVRIGTEYGGWVIPKGFLSEKSVCYCAGAGEDISFDSGLAERFGCHVWIVDPTPRAVAHYNSLKEHVLAGKPFMVNNRPNDFYQISTGKIHLLHYLPIGLWHQHEFLKFYAPQDNSHVSHSIVNLQKTDHYFEAEVKRLKDVMAEQGHTSLDLLKIDIEGAEYDVIDTILQDQLDIKVLCVEHDEWYHQKDGNYLKRINDCIAKVKAAGYVLIDLDSAANATYVRRDVVLSLKQGAIA